MRPMLADPFAQNFNRSIPRIEIFQWSFRRNSRCFSSPVAPKAVITFKFGRSSHADQALYDKLEAEIRVTSTACTACPSSRECTEHSVSPTWGVHFHHIKYSSWGRVTYHHITSPCTDPTIHDIIPSHLITFCGQTNHHPIVVLQAARCSRAVAVADPTSLKSLLLGLLQLLSQMDRGNSSRMGCLSDGLVESFEPRGSLMQCLPV